MEKERGDGNTILLTVIGVATLLVALVGATFAYFSTQIQNDAQQSVGITTAAPAGLSYLGQKFELTNIIPGTTNTDEQGKFEVTNPGTSTVAQKYDLELVVDTNTLNNFDGDGQLLLSVTSANATVSNTADNATAITDGVQWDLTNGDDLTTEQQAKATAAGLTTKGTLARAAKNYVFVQNQRIEPGVTQTYQMTLNFVNFENATQDYNQGKAFSAHVELKNQVSVK